MEKRIKTLAELKGEEVLLRDKIEASKGTLQDVLDLNRKRKAIRELESWLLWTILLLVIFVATGCIENTMRGAGRMIQGTGELVSGMGKDIIRGTDGYSEK